MSEEEKKAIEYIKEFQKELYGASSKNLMAHYLDKVLNLIDKQEKEIEELRNAKKDREKVIEIIIDTEDNLDQMFIKLIRLFKIPKEKVKTCCISKDKIREKIEQIGNYTFMSREEMNRQEYAIEVLIELLEE